ncbi:hypothetical protein N0V93_007605 [Gnomoniopsis smithogilvyi]|uniref:Fungal lipase-type domain-containing protein n=1 Tax=Gnomoniopsis smithogilvyi TaxID=1191159 RepID=A0A9W8YT03_9PEZI|nr:hypothetical protein N0V93_007605 [Gnomoniopsis smithogilvyi]
MQVSRLSLLLIAVSRTISSPYEDNVVKPRDSVSVGVNTEDLAHLTKFAQYAGAAYCDPVAGRPVYCKGDICPAGNHSNATIYSVFHGIETDVLGFIAVDSTTQEIIISVRGSVSLHNWLADVVWARQPSTMCRGCWAHLGFLFACSEIARNVNATLFSATKLFPNYKITLTGHSLGAAVGTLLAMRLRDMGYEMDLYTYGSPRVGNEALASYISHQKGRDWPGPSWRTRYDAAEIEVCTGYANAACNAGAPWWVLDITSHLYYFVAISHCGETEEPRLRFANEPLNGTTAVNSSESGLDQATADTLAMYAKLDQEYAAALQTSGIESDVVF